MHEPATQSTERALFAFNDLSHYARLKRSQLYALIRADKFPKPLKIGKSARWVKSQVDDWIAAQVAQQAILPPLEQQPAPAAPQPAKAKPTARRKQPQTGPKWSAATQAA